MSLLKGDHLSVRYFVCFVVQEHIEDHGCQTSLPDKTSSGQQTGCSMLAPPRFVYTQTPQDVKLTKAALEAPSTRPMHQTTCAHYRRPHFTWGKEDTVVNSVKSLLKRSNDDHTGQQAFGFGLVNPFFKTETDEEESQSERKTGRSETNIKRDQMMVPERDNAASGTSPYEWSQRTAVLAYLGPLVSSVKEYWRESKAEIQAGFEHRLAKDNDSVNEAQLNIKETSKEELPGSSGSTSKCFSSYSDSGEEPILGFMESVFKSDDECYRPLQKPCTTHEHSDKVSSSSTAGNSSKRPCKLNKSSRAKTQRLNKSPWADFEISKVHVKAPGGKRVKRL